MHRTQIYFEEPLFDALKREAARVGVSLSAYIRDRLRQDIEQQHHTPSPSDFSEFAGMWRDRDIDQQTIRNDAWKR
jgi:hypothetical protein